LQNGRRRWRIAGLKQGGGVGRKGGFGYLHGQEFREPFSNALKGTMLSLMLPEGNEADIRFTQLAIADLKRRWVQQVQPIHAQDMLSKEKTVPSWNIKREKKA
jgi:hypothetical protein